MRGRARIEVTATELDTWRRSHGTVERTAAMLRAYRRRGVLMIAVEDVLDLLGADPDTPPPPAGRDPLADPLTGCLPVTAGSPVTAPPR